MGLSYLHFVAVKEEYRNYGIGKQLIKFFEDNASDSSSAKYFLTVDDFNLGAKILYENPGYKCVGELPDFYKKGINCYLMMKRRDGHVVQRKLVAVHSVINKVTGLLLFILPLTFPIVPLKYLAIPVCAVATFAAVQEGHFIRTDPDIK